LICRVAGVAQTQKTKIWVFCLAPHCKKRAQMG
jgi:hypothetical protein